MTPTDRIIQRDLMIEALAGRMAEDSSLFFLSADFGAPALDNLRNRFPDRFLNLGVAEQNTIGVAAGLALEGFKVIVYGIATFISMRPFEQIRTSLSLLAANRAINVNIISVGAGMSYDVSGPTHHCVEDLPLMRVLPNLEIFSPSDGGLIRMFVAGMLEEPYPKYIRLEGKAVEPVHNHLSEPDFRRGFREVRKGGEVCLVATGFMTHRALEVAETLAAQGANPGVVDLFLLKGLDRTALAKVLAGYETVVSLEEGYLGVGGIDALVCQVINPLANPPRLLSYGLPHGYNFERASREELHLAAGIDAPTVARQLAHSLLACQASAPVP